ncbi:ribosomal RNA-processing protein 7-domain-containing protein, partial [Lentinula raphanica]
MSSSTLINGFTLFPISYASTSTHYILARAHESGKKGPSSWPSGRTLFLVNVPPDSTERDLILLLKPYGIVEKVVFDSDSPVQDDAEDEADSDEEEEEEEEQEAEDHNDMEEADESHPRKRRKVATKKIEPPKVFPLPSISLRNMRKTGQTAHVVFLDTSSLDRFFSASHTKPRPWPTSEEPSGLSHYFALYDSLRPPLDAVRQHANTAMDLYEFELAKSKRVSKYKKGEAIVDEDGFTLVTRGGAYGQTVGGGVAVATKKFQETGEASERNKKRTKKEKTSFYAFQKAEKQRNALIQLKKNWELDKAKVEKLKASRKFKPY